MSALKKPMSLLEIAKKHNVKVSFLIKELAMGVKEEKEHTTDEKVARTIALQHLAETPDYYTRLKRAHLKAGGGIKNGRTIAQTPAPKSDKIHGSNVNPKGSAATEKSAEKIKLSDVTVKVLQNKLDAFKAKHPQNKTVTLNDLKAVYRRGSGAYSSSHRPTITEGAPNSRSAWSFARVNKFLEKAAGHKVKKAYVQDDDLLKYAEGGVLVGGGMQHNDGNKGGYIKGRRHSDGGVKAVNTATGQPLEVEGDEVQIVPKAATSNKKHTFQGKELSSKQILSKINTGGGGVPIGKAGGRVYQIQKEEEGGVSENSGDLKLPPNSVIITRRAVLDNTKREFDGEMLTNRQILSRINESGGGVSFADGGELPHECNCSGKSYKYGGKTMADSDIVEDIISTHARKTFGLLHPHLPHGEAFDKIIDGKQHGYMHNGIEYEEGGMVRLVDKKVPSLLHYSHKNKEVGGSKLMNEYKKHLQYLHGVAFDSLSQPIKKGLIDGNQKLVDNFLNN